MKFSPSTDVARNMARIPSPMPRTPAPFRLHGPRRTRQGEPVNHQGGAVSSRHTRSFFGVMLAVVFALSAVVVAPASAKLTKHQKAHVRKQLKRAIKKNPRLIKSKRFIKKASLVDFSLPVTIKLRPKHFANSTANPNKAGIDLGAALGQRDIGLGGVIKAHIQFHDSFDGGALGNVDLTLDPGGSLVTTSI